jgi:uncharacterized protein (DUF885 family)
MQIARRIARQITRRGLLRLLGAAAMAAGAAPRSVPASAGGAAHANAGFTQRFAEAFLDQYWQRNTDAAIAVGYYRVADRLTVPDARYRREYLQFLDAALRQLHEVRADRLDARQRTDWAVLDSQLRYERWALTRLREWQWNPAQYNVAEPFALICNTDYAPLDQRLRSALARLRDVPAYYDAARQAIDDPTLEHTRLAIEQNQGTLELFDVDLQQRLAAATLGADERALFARRLAAARAAITGFVGWLEGLQQSLAGGGGRSFRLGRVLYAEKFQFVHQSGEDAATLYGRALQEKQQVLQRMAQLSEQLWSRYLAGEQPPADRFDRIGRLIGKLSEHHVAPADYLPGIERLIPQLVQWVQQHDLIDLDPTAPLQVRPTPAYERGVAIAGVDAPGPYDPGARTYFNVDPIDRYSDAQAESFLREYNDWTLPVFIIHEAIPGHYVQLMYANRSPSRIKSLFGNGAMIEGWAVYCERMMLESGYGAQAPEQWLLYWKWYLRSVTNTILDYGVHVLGMSEAEARLLLMREAFQSEKEAAAKWLRVQRSSVQLTQYFAGFSAIYRLRTRLEEQQGPRFQLKRFHEQFLSHGSAPVKVIEELMTTADTPA